MPSMSHIVQQVAPAPPPRAVRMEETEVFGDPETTILPQITPAAAEWARQARARQARAQQVPWPAVEEDLVFTYADPPATQSIVAENAATEDAAPENAVLEAEAPPPVDELPEDEPNYLLWGGMIAAAVTLLGAGTYLAIKKKK